MKRINTMVRALWKAAYKAFKSDRMAGWTPAFSILPLALLCLVASLIGPARSQGGGSLNLPYNQTASSSSCLFNLTNTGLGGALCGTGGSGAGVTGTSYNGYGIYGTSNLGYAGYFVSGNSSAMVGISNAASATGILGVGATGIYGQSSGSGPGVLGTSASGSGLYGKSTNGYGAYGFSTNADGGYFVTGSTNGNAMGLYGSSPNGYGIYGYSSSGEGVAGQSTSSWGVHGNSTSGYGVYGSSANSIGVYGASNSYNGGYFTSGGNGVGVTGTGNTNSGVYGHSNSYVGVYGASDSGLTGVFGGSPVGYGVYGSSGSSAGVYGSSSSSDGVRGYSSSGTGVYGSSPNGYAGYFSGNLQVTGTITAGTKDFKIDHPLDPANKYLVHACVESSEMKTVYDGTILTDANGDAVVALPDWFEALNKEFRYQLTVVGQFAQAVVATEIENNRFTIKTDRPNVKVCWQVTGVRHDAFAKAHPLAVEQEKSEKERGKYLHPVENGMPESLGIDYEILQRMKQSTHTLDRTLHSPGRRMAAPRPESRLSATGSTTRGAEPTVRR